MANLTGIDFGIPSPYWAPSGEGMPPKGTWPVTLTLLDRTTLAGDLGLDGGDPLEVTGDTNLGTYSRSYMDLSSIVISRTNAASVVPKSPPNRGDQFIVKTQAGDAIQASDLYWQKRCSGDNQRREIPVAGGLRIGHDKITRAEFYDGPTVGQLSVRLNTIYGESAVYAFDFGKCPRGSWLLFGDTALGRLHLSVNMVSGLESASGVIRTPVPKPERPSPGPYDYGPSGKLLTRDGRLFEFRNLMVMNSDGLEFQDGNRVDLKKVTKLEFPGMDAGGVAVVITGGDGSAARGVVAEDTIISARVVLGRVELPVQEIGEILIYP